MHGPRHSCQILTHNKSISRSGKRLGDDIETKPDFERRHDQSAADVLMKYAASSSWKGSPQPRVSSTAGFGLDDIGAVIGRTSQTAIMTLV